jgi:hypothetical protein
VCLCWLVLGVGEQVISITYRADCSGSREVHPSPTNLAMWNGCGMVFLQELNTYKLGRGDMETQIKNFLIANTRQGRAFQEIRRLIEWAVTPPSSSRSSLAGCVMLLSDPHLTCQPHLPAFRGAPVEGGWLEKATTLPLSCCRMNALCPFEACWPLVTGKGLLCEGRPCHQSVPHPLLLPICGLQAH